MYVITRNAAVWQANATPEAVLAIVAGFLATDGNRWAARPLKLSHQTCIGLRREGEAVHVLVLRRGRRQWLPVEQVLELTQLRRWLERDFVASAMPSQATRQASATLAPTGGAQ